MICVYVYVMMCRDAKAMADKKAAKAAEKEAKLANDPHGNATAAYDAADARKAKQKSDKKERQKESGQYAKAERRAEGKF